MEQWHQISADSALMQLQSDAETGLSEAAAAARRAQSGPNELVGGPGRGPLRILWEQLSGAMVVLLLVAAVVSVLLDEPTDAAVILAIVVLNAALGFLQDHRAEKALAALKQLAVPTVRVRRDGKIAEIGSDQLVPGDIVMLEVGNYVPADCRLLQSVNLSIDEAALTGESVPSDKQTEPLEGEDVPLGDRSNMAFMGTVVTFGHGQGVVTQIGMNTELGQIAGSLQSVRPAPTPLQTRLAKLGRMLALVAIAIVGVVFVLGVARQEDPQLMIMTSLSLAVAVVPEGLPAVATVALAIGARRMLKRKALIRKLPAVETLGSVTVICSDKTGTLTENRMAVSAMVTMDCSVQFSRNQPISEVFDSAASAATDATVDRADQMTGLSLLLAAAALCNDAELVGEHTDGRIDVVGEPTEAALLVAAQRAGLNQRDLQAVFPRQAEVPFDSIRKRMTTLHAVNASASPSRPGPLALAEQAMRGLAANQVAFTKGAIDCVLDHCRNVWDGGDVEPLDQQRKATILAAHDSLAAGGMRVLGVALKSFGAADAPLDESISQAPAIVESDSMFLGILGLIDPPRSEVAAAIASCQAAGIRPLMITGDHPLTAAHIGQQLGIAQNAQTLPGPQLDKLTDDELRDVVEQTSVYARVTPKHKLRLVKALQANGQIVAMTGDGVNDAPALKQAHIGVAMGITGTDVSREASQMVLLDDNFATIVGAVEEGRVVYDNIRKFVKYTMTSNAGEVAVMLLGPLFGMPLPLLPLHILWINLVTDGLPGLALAIEPAERDAMQRPPYPPNHRIFDRRMVVDIIWIGLAMAGIALTLGHWSWSAETSNDGRWRTIVFTVVTLTQLGNALAIRSTRESLFRIGVFSNPALVFSVVLTFGLQMCVIFWPPLQTLFKTTALTATELLVSVAASTLLFWAIELEKRVIARRDSAAANT